MDNHSRFCYAGGHETSWQSRAAGRTPPESDWVAALGRDLSKGGLGCESVVELSGAVESSLSAERENGLAHEADPRAAAAADARPDGDSNQAAGRGRAAGGVRHGPLDAAPSRGFDREALRCALWTDRRPTVAAATLGMDLAEAGAPGDGAQGRGDCQMETGRLA